MGNGTTPDAPLTHSDEQEHRRLIATRANRIGYEEGEFVSTFDFVTPGDLSNVYTRQFGYFWRIGPVVNFSFDVSVTPTYTTASGEAKIGGLPYASAANDLISYLSIRLISTGVTWPESDIVGFVRPSASTVGVAFQGTGVNGSNMDAGDMTTAVVFRLLGTGFYAI